MRRSSALGNRHARSARPVATLNPGGRAWRFHLVRVVLTLTFVIVVLRLGQIQVLEHARYAAMGQEQYAREIVVRGDRGTIYDRRHTALALNEPSYDIGLDRSQFKDKDSEDLREVCRKLARVLDQSAASLLRKARSRHSFAFLARGVDPERGSLIKMMRLRGVQVVKTSKRVYPLDERLAQVLGFVNVDGHGISGLELAFDRYLAGQDGVSVLQRDARGNPILSTPKQERKPGHDLVLTIDHVYQTVAEEELAAAVTRFHAKGGMVVITNPNTGEILAMASLPSFDPNEASRYRPEAWRIRPVTDIFEPGSTFKIVTLAAALSQGVDRRLKRVFCENGRFRIAGEEINDAKKYGWLRFEDVFVHSSNIGTAKIASEVGKYDLFKTARAFGFGNKTGIELPGEVTGILRRPTDWSDFSVLAISYGHEVAVTPLQIAMAYGAIANGGKLMQPYVVSKVVDRDGHAVWSNRPRVIRRVLEPETARHITQILKMVVESGTGRKARLPNAVVAGKTGTAQKTLIRRLGYSQTRYLASFAGFYPVEGAEILIYVAIDEPRPAHSGGEVAAPTFRNILSRILDMDKELRERGRPVPPRAALASTQVIPDFTNRKLVTAVRILRELGITPKIQGQGAIVRAQEIRVPESESEPPEIVLTIGDFPPQEEYVEVPSVTGLSLRKALLELAVRGLEAKVVGSGRVIKQEPAAGSKMKVGARCYLVCEPVLPVSVRAKI